METADAAGLDRDFQRRLLVVMAKHFPIAAQADELGFEPDNNDFVRAMAYLHQHELVEALSSETLGRSYVVLQGKITAAGLDFLKDDGGLTAILNTVTVRFEADTLRALMSSHIQAAAIPQEEKSALMQWLSAAGAEALKEATRRLVGLGLENLPAAIPLLRTVLG